MSDSLSTETHAACTATPDEIEGLKSSQKDDIIFQIAKDIKEMKLQQSLDKKEISDLKSQV